MDLGEEGEKVKHCVVVEVFTICKSSFTVVATTPLIPQ